MWHHAVWRGTDVVTPCGVERYWCCDSMWCGEVLMLWHHEVWRGTDVVTPCGVERYWCTTQSYFLNLPSSTLKMEAASISQTLVIYKCLVCHGICCSKYSIIGSYATKDNKFVSVSFSNRHSKFTESHSPNYKVLISEGHNVNIRCH